MIHAHVPRCHLLANTALQKIELAKQLEYVGLSTIGNTLRIFLAVQNSSIGDLVPCLKEKITPGVPKTPSQMDVAPCCYRWDVLV